MNNIQIYDENGNALNTLSQYDTNRTIKIFNYEYADSGTTMVYFSNASSENAYGVEATVSDKTVSATIPNILLTYSEKISIYVAQEVSSDSETTRITYFYSELLVKKRSMPADYVADNDVTYISITALKAELESTISDIETKVANGDFDGKDGTTIKVGTTTTSAAGTSAKVSSSLNATTNTLTLNFTIPRGADGSSTSSSAGTTDYKALENLPRTPLTVTAETNLQELAEGTYDVYTADDEAIMLDTCDIELKTGDFIIYHDGMMIIGGSYIINDATVDYSTWREYFAIGAADVNTAIRSSVSGELTNTLTKSGTKYRMETEYTYRLGEQTSIALKGTNSDYGNYDFHSELIFKSGDTATTFTYRSGWIFSGDDCTDGVFIPQANTTYVVKFKNISATDGEEEIVGRVEAYGTVS